MKTIHKFPLKITDMQQIIVSYDSEILTAQFQNDQLCLWVLVDTEKAPVSRFIEILGTGNPIPTDMGIDRKYISTAQQHSGSLVWHIFERL